MLWQLGVGIMMTLGVLFFALQVYAFLGPTPVAKGAKVLVLLEPPPSFTLRNFAASQELGSAHCCWLTIRARRVRQGGHRRENTPTEHRSGAEYLRHRRPLPMQ